MLCDTKKANKISKTLYQKCSGFSISHSYTMLNSFFFSLLPHQIFRNRQTTSCVRLNYLLAHLFRYVTPKIILYFLCFWTILNWLSISIFPISLSLCIYFLKWRVSNIYGYVARKRTIRRTLLAANILQRITQIFNDNRK